MGACLLSIIWGVSQNGRDPSCISTTLSWLPTSAPGPPPRVGVASGLSQAARAVKLKAINNIVGARFTSHSFSREDDNQAEDEADYKSDTRGPYLTDRHHGSEHSTPCLVDHDTLTL